MADLSQFQPRYPEGRVLAPLFEQAAELVAECHRLGGASRGICRSGATPAPEGNEFPLHEQDRGPADTPGRYRESAWRGLTRGSTTQTYREEMTSMAAARSRRKSSWPLPVTSSISAWIKSGSCASAEFRNAEGSFASALATFATSAVANRQRKIGDQDRSNGSTSLRRDARTD